MRLGYKILVPQLLLLGLLVAASAMLVLDLGTQERERRSTLQRLEAATRLANHLKDVHADIAVAVLAYRLERNSALHGSIAQADQDATRLLEEHARVTSEPGKRALLAAVAEARSRVRASRSDLIRALDPEAGGGVHAAFARWRLHQRLLAAHLEDLSADDMDRFAREGQRIAEERVALTRNLLLAVAVAIVITAAAFFYVRGSLTLPLGRLVAGIAAFGPGKLHARIDSRIQDSRDEIGQVARAFNGMAGEIEGLNATLERRVEQRTVQLEAANKELQAFAYSVSHDLRSPLRAIDGFSLALLADYGEKLDDEGKDSLRRVREASQRMGHLIDDMLTLSRVTRGETTREPVDLSALAQSTADELTQSAPERRVTVRIERGIVARSDGRLLGAVMANLLSNAWKFTAGKDAATIEFGAERRDGELVCHVRDDGAGFEMAYVGNLFEPFQRLHGATEFPGNGIGLATVKRVIARLGGRVWAEGAVGRGATFYFSLPDAPEGEANPG